jgi:glycosyltransferase involved in cell wall biosynthesis
LRAVWLGKIQAWQLAGLSAPSTALVLVGDGPIRARAVATGAACLEGTQPPEQVRNFYAGSDVVVVPSIPTRDFLEPWGLVVNEAFNRGVPVIATDAVGAVAGGLMQHERTGLVVPAEDAPALAAALRRLHDDPELRSRLGAAGREAVRAYSHEAWAGGMSAALRAAGASRSPC